MTGPDTKYMVMHLGEWRPVLHMVAANGLPTPSVMHASALVVWMDGREREVLLNINMSDIVTRPDRRRQESRWYKIVE